MGGLGAWVAEREVMAGEEEERFASRRVSANANLGLSCIEMEQTEPAVAAVGISLIVRQNLVNGILMIPFNGLQVGAVVRLFLEVGGREGCVVRLLGLGEEGLNEVLRIGKQPPSVLRGAHQPV
jgi:hypothetical protein